MDHAFASARDALTVIAAYHQFWMFNSLAQAFEVKHENGGVFAVTLTGVPLCAVFLETCTQAQVCGAPPSGRRRVAQTPKSGPA